MKKPVPLKHLILPLLSLVCIPTAANAAPYGPKGREIHWTQPDGEPLTLRVFGDELYARTETKDGYTVVLNNQDHAYYYAKLDATGTKLQPSGIRADDPAQGLNPHIDLPGEQIRAIRLQNAQKFDGGRAQRWQQRVKARQQMRAAGAQAAEMSANPAAAPITGDKVGLTILVQFPGLDYPAPRTKMVSFLNGENYTGDGNTGSVRDYFFDQSLGKLTYTQSVTQFVTMPQPRDFYNYSDYPTNSIPRDAGDAGRLVVTDAVALLKQANYDFSSLSLDPTTSDALATNIFFAGPDSGIWSMGLWPHSWNMGGQKINVGTPSSPIYVNNYQITNTEDDAPTIGTFCHENGHLLLGYPDLYTYTFGEGEGVGQHCLMGSGNHMNNGRTPAPIDVYLKDAVGWATITDIAPTDSVTAALPTTGNVGYRIRKPGLATEAFIIENRGPGDKWTSAPNWSGPTNDQGIMIWHVDENIDGNGNGLTPHYGIALIQADGRMDLENDRNRGDSTDLFDLVTPLFNDTSNPAAKWWDGSSSLAQIKVLGAVGKKTDVQFGTLPPDTIALSSPNGGEMLFRDSDYNITWDANISGNVRIDLYLGGNLRANIAQNAPDTGSYLWRVPANMASRSDYTVRISSVTNPKPTSDESDAPFTITDFTFPDGKQLPYGWYTPEDANAGFEVSASLAYEGGFCVKNQTISDGQKAAIAYTSDFKAGAVSFYLRVSSESGYDFATFYIDGVRQALPNTLSPKGLTGNTDWTFVSIPVSAGTHTFKWVYIKDDSYAGGKDTAWLDAVALPPTTQEIGLADATGLALINRQSEYSLENTLIGTTSEPITFTIRNRGNADLHGLKLALKGTDANAFEVGGLSATALKPGESTTFKAWFKPRSVGQQHATIKVISNDEDESPFLIQLTARSIGVPKISVFQPDDEQLKDGKSTRDFGRIKVGDSSRTRTFTVRNTGSREVRNLQISKDGKDKADFNVGALGVTTLAPGESTTFKVVFTPTSDNKRIATISIAGSNSGRRTFELDLTGMGLPRNKQAGQKSAIALLDVIPDAGAHAPYIAPATSTMTIDGRKFLTLTFTSPAAGPNLPSRVEVSSNLIDWYSGTRYTTLVSDNGRVRVVRDNTPVTRDHKRYIRLAPIRR